MSMEHKIGDKFNFNGVELKVEKVDVAHDNCLGCHGYGNSICIDLPVCSFKDGTQVIFKQINNS